MPKTKNLSAADQKKFDEVVEEMERRCLEDAEYLYGVVHDFVRMWSIKDIRSAYAEYVESGDIADPE